MGSELINASLDYYRDVSNAMSEASFFELYGNLFSLTMADKDGKRLSEQVVEPRQLPVVQAALAKIAKGGFAEAATRIGFMLQRQGEPLPLSRIEMRAEVAREYHDLLPDRRRMRCAAFVASRKSSSASSRKKHWRPCRRCWPIRWTGSVC